MKTAWLLGVALPTLALMMSSAPALPAPAQTYDAKLVAGGSFVEEAKWDTTQAHFEHDSGTGKFTVHVSASKDIQLQVIDGTVSVIDVGHKPQGGTVSTNFEAEGTHIQIGQPSSNDHGTLRFASGGAGTATTSETNDFDLNGGNLGFTLSYQTVLSGTCADDKFGANCSENTATPGVPEILAGGNPMPLNGKMSVNGGGGFTNAPAPLGQTTGMASNSAPWTGMSCHGDIKSGWTCAFAGSRVWNKAPGVSYTQRVQFNARITIVDRVK
jgi:hypothetical protein